MFVYDHGFHAGKPVLSFASLPFPQLSAPFLLLALAAVSRKLKQSRRAEPPAAVPAACPAHSSECICDFGTCGT